MLPPLLPNFNNSNGKLIKQMVTDGLESFLSDMQFTLDFMAANSARAIYRRVLNYADGIEHMVQQSDPNVPPEFDWILPSLTETYRELIAVVKASGNVRGSISPLKRTSTSGHRLGHPVWTLEEAFVHMPDFVAYDLSQLRDWVVGFVDTGIRAAASQLPALLDQSRRTDLMPRVLATQQKALELDKKYGSLFHQQCSPQVYVEYAAARDELLELRLDL